MDAAPRLDLSHAPVDTIISVLQCMSLIDRFTCALVCKAWAEAATAATHSITLRHRVDDLSCLQRWLEKHGHQLKGLQLHHCRDTRLTALPCPQLQDLLLHGQNGFDIDSSVWSDIKAATKLTPVSFSGACTTSQQADVVSALTALPDLEQLAWTDIRCSDVGLLSDSLLLRQLTQLTALNLMDVTEAALEHLSLLSKLQRLELFLTFATFAWEWTAASIPGLQELKALTSLNLDTCWHNDIPASVYQLTALQQLIVSSATPTALNGLQALIGLTQLCVCKLKDLSHMSPPLQLPTLQHLEFGSAVFMPKSFLINCTQLRVLSLNDTVFVGAGSLVASNLLQHLKLKRCGINAADGAAAPDALWQQVFSAAGQLPHLTYLELTPAHPDLQQADIECVVACCSSLQVLRLHTLHDSFTSALMRLSGLTSFHLHLLDNQQCSSLAQLTGLRELKVNHPKGLSAVGLRQLAALKQLTSLGCTIIKHVNRQIQAQMSDSLLGFPHAILSNVRASPEGARRIV